MIRPAIPPSVIRSVSIGALLALSNPSEAAPTPYTSLAAFLAATSSRATDALDDLSITSSTASPLSRRAGGYGYSASTSTGGSFFGAGSGADHWLSTNLATDSILFGSFTGGVNAIGGLFFGSDLDGAFQSGALVLTATDATGTTMQMLDGATIDTFVGFVSTGALLSLSVTPLQPAGAFLWPTVDDLILGQRAVAEPAVAALLALGFGVLGFGTRRRRASDGGGRGRPGEATAFAKVSA